MACRDISRRLVNLREATVTEARQDLCVANAKTAWIGFALCSVATVLTGGLSAPVTGPAAVCCWGWGFGSVVVGQGLQEAENSRMRERIASCANLRRRFPKLRRVLAWRGQV